MKYFDKISMDPVELREGYQILKPGFLTKMKSGKFVSGSIDNKVCKKKVKLKKKRLMRMMRAPFK